MKQKVKSEPVRVSEGEGQQFGEYVVLAGVSVFPFGGFFSERENVSLRVDLVKKGERKRKRERR